MREEVSAGEIARQGSAIGVSSKMTSPMSWASGSLAKMIWYSMDRSCFSVISSNAAFMAEAGVQATGSRPAHIP